MRGRPPGVRAVTHLARLKEQVEVYMPRMCGIRPGEMATYCNYSARKMSHRGNNYSPCIICFHPDKIWRGYHSITGCVVYRLFIFSTSITAARQWLEVWGQPSARMHSDWAFHQWKKLTLPQAGLCSREYCPALKEVHNYTPEPIEEEKPDKLSLALEPESAAIFCQYMSQKQRFNSDWDFDKKFTNYLIVDIGGGTVDISAHCLVRDPEPHIRVIHPPTGNNYGGTQVNEKFKQFLKDMVKDPGFDRFVSTNDQVINSRNQFILDLLLKEKFELQKKVFEKNDKNYKGVIELPSAFFKTYEHDLMQSILDDDDSTVELVDQDLRLSHKVMSSFFKDVVKGIIQCIRETLKEVGNIKYIYLVGGFGGTQYVEKVLKDEFDKDSIKCIVPVEPAYAVVRGAALFKLNPNVIECRKVDATYGIKTNIAFKTGLHDPKYRWINDDNQLRCDNIFNTVVQKGDIVGTGEVFLTTFYPACHNQKSMLIMLYSSQDTDIFYVTGEWGIGKCEPRHTVTKIGQIIVEMPVPDGDKKRGVDVMFSFSHTEIKVRAFDKTSKTEVKVVFDFLTTK